MTRTTVNTPKDPCKNCAFHNPTNPYGCEMTEDIPTICSVKMRKMKQEKIEEKKT